MRHLLWAMPCVAGLSCAALLSVNGLFAAKDDPAEDVALEPSVELPIGSHTPLWCTASGKLYLASLPPEQRERVLPSLPLQRMARNTLTDLSALRDDLARVREEQLGTDCEEFIDGMVACAVPVRASDGELLAGLFSHAPVIRCSMAQLLAFVPRMRAASRELAAVLGSAAALEADQST